MRLKPLELLDNKVKVKFFDNFFEMNLQRYELEVFFVKIIDDRLIDDRLIDDRLIDDRLILACRQAGIVDNF